MNDKAQANDAAAVTMELDLAATRNRHAKSSLQQHRRALYRRKDKALATALLAGDDQFVVDSVQQVNPLVLGLSHKLSLRRFHVRPASMPPEIQKMLTQLPRADACDVEASHAKLRHGAGEVKSSQTK